MNNKNVKEYSKLIRETCLDILPVISEKWKPYKKESTKDDEVNFLLHVAGSLLSKIAEALAEATNLKASEIVKDLTDSLIKAMREDEKEDAH